MRSKFKHLPGPVAGVLRRYYWLKRAYGLLRIACVSAVLYLALALLVMHLDRFLFLTSETRLLLSRGVHGVAAGYALLLLAGFLIRRPSTRVIAYEMEGRLADRAAERYVTLDSVLREPASPENTVRRDLLDQLVRTTERHSGAVRPLRLVRDRNLGAAAVALVLLGGVCALLALAPGYQFGLMARRFLSPAANLPKPSFLRIQATPQSIVVGKGGEAVIQAEIQGDIPFGLAWLYNLAGATPNRCLIASAAGRHDDVRVDPRTARELNRVQRRVFMVTQTELQESFTYRLRCGDAETEVRFVEVVSQPRVVELKVAIEPPAYTRLPAQEIVNPRQPLRIFPNSRVEIVFTVDQDVPTRQVLAAGREIAALKWDEAARAGRYAFTMRDKTELEVRVVNARGFANVDRVRVSLVRREDQPPNVTLEYPPAELTVVPGELVPLQALAEDDLEVSEAAMRHLLNPESSPDTPFQEMPIVLPEAHATRVSLAENFDLGQTTAGPGDELLLTVRVRDSAGKDSESRPARIRVTSFARGENERRRAAALGMLGNALAGLAEKPPAPGDAAIDKDLYERLRKQASAAGVALADAPTFDSLFRFMELEQHFTDAPRHKDDLRKLAGVLRAAWLTGRLPSAPAAAPAWPAVLARDVAGPMARSRQLQNLAWRVFGMQHEIGSLRQRLAGAQDEETRQERDRKTTVEEFVLSVLEEAGKRRDVADAYKREMEIRRRISDIKAKAETPKQEGTAFDNPFAPLQLDVDAARLSPENAKKVEELNRELSEVAAERRRLTEKAVQEILARWNAGLKGRPAPLEAKDMALLAATAFDRALKPAPGAPGMADAGTRRQLAATLADERLKGGGQTEQPARKAIRRRTDLYLKALEAIGVELAAVAESAPERLDAVRLKEIQTELNTAGYYLGRGGWTRNMASCDEVAGLLTRLLREIRRALPALLRDEQRARDRLDGLARAAAAQAAAGFPATAGGAGRWDLALQWAEADLRMLERSPFAAIGSRLRGVALSAFLDRRRHGAADEPAFAEPSAAVARALDDEQRLMDLLGLAWERDELLAAERVSAAEKALGTRLLAMAAALQARRPAAEAEALEKSLLDLPLEAAAPPAGADDFVRKGLAEVSLAGMDAGLARAAKDWLPAGNPRDEAGRALTRMDAAAQAVDALETALNGGDSGVSRAMANVAEALDDALWHYEYLVRLAALDTGSVTPLAADAGQEEALFLRIREAVGRYRGRAGEVVRAMGENGAREPDAAQLGNLRADLTIVKAGVQALRTSLKAGMDEFGAKDSGRKYPILETFAETRAWVGVARALVDSNRPAEIAERFVAESAAARVRFLEARASLLETGLRELREAEKGLDGATPDLAAAQRRIDEARRALDMFREAAGKAGKGDVQDRMRQGAADAVARLDRLGRGAASKAEIDRRLLALAEAIQLTEGMLRRLKAEVAAAVGPRLEYGGGPDGIWLPETRMDAEAARQRLLGQIRHAQRGFMAGVLEALEPKPDPARLRDAERWSLFCHRVARSPLSGIVTPPRSEAGGESARNPLVKWLLEQVDEAVRETQREDTLRNYRGISREMIQSVKDFLRY